MRLEKVAKGADALRTRMMLTVIKVLSRREAPDVVKTLMYRKAFFGGAMNQMFQAAMRGESAWSVGERELMATYVSTLNQCVF